MLRNIQEYIHEVIKGCIRRRAREREREREERDIYREREREKRAGEMFDSMLSRDQMSSRYSHLDLIVF